MIPRGFPNAQAFRPALSIATLLAVLALVLGTAVPSHASSGPAPASVPGAAQTLAGPVKTSLAGFSPGNIISDAVFTDKDTMTEAQIQAFFNSKVKACQSGYVCLKDFRMDTVNRPADAYCKGYTGAAGESAARIIHRASQSCGINPQVLIVMLQKEQSLVTHTWPSTWRYDAALGQGCPDGGVACNPLYVGFFHQIYGAARQMQLYMEGRYFTWYAPGKTWNILYHPNKACGTAPVRVVNKATSALYYYTPYQPNAAAIRAGYGTGDSCSSYGNRNFYSYFTDWFGSTQAPAPTEPPPPTPTLSSVDRSDYVAAVDGQGVLWGYPFGRSLWGARQQLASGLPASGQLLGVGDLNGDGFRDFIVLDRGTASALALYGNGTTNITSKVKLAGNWSGVVLATAAGDFDGDGVPDLFTTDSAGRLFLRSGDDRGGLRAPVQVGQSWAGFDLLTGGVDMNGDGHPDLIARDTAGILHLYPGSGRGGFGAPVQIGPGWGGLRSVFSPGDFTGDRLADVIAESADGTLTLYRGTGRGLIAHVGPVGAGWQTMVTKTGVGEPITRPRAPIAGAGDIDGAAGNDVLALTPTGDAVVYGGNGSGSWSGQSTIGQKWGVKDRLVAMADFNGDGRRDIGRVDSSGAFLLYPGRASGGVGTPTRIGTSWGAFLHLIGGIDFDGDRNPDVLAISKDGALWLYRGNGRGGWLTGAGQQVGQGWAAFDEVFYAGDLKADGGSNLLARLPDGRLFAYPISRTGKWGASRQVGNGWQVMKNVFSPGDFDGDGHPDLLAVARTGEMYLYPGDGRGSWGTRRQVGTAWQSMLQIR